eukprot:CAMPEP_0168775736 /NCGR_PEP_ID=MMETSP0725-20121227/5667_1 /TAXON_ID=265536 /ORGANISM="Amphiprora sp., Strain CCMP467" /LENGTH=623 /DNA_ID=CAMNT_0008825377 /DNA_START=38 /DNA_END=1909 /DNA_ORIENTATION=-
MARAAVNVVVNPIRNKKPKMLLTRPSTILLWVTAASCLLMTSQVATAESHKDQTYYAPGKWNPNTKTKMYWHDSSDVLQDLSHFSRLYVQYHNCAWSPFGTPANDDENLAFESYWYLGLTQTYRANVAFSLYGILKGSINTGGCSQKTYINSFFTDYGAQHFVEALQMNGYLYTDDVDNANAYNEYNANGNDDGGGNRKQRQRRRRKLQEGEEDGDDEYFDWNEVWADQFGDQHDGTVFSLFTSTCSAYMNNDDGQVDDGNVPGYGEMGFPNAMSYTLGCSEDHKFEYHSYGGATCDGHQYNGVVDTLDDANMFLEDAGCMLLYDSKQHYNNAYGYEYTPEYDDQFWNNYANQGWGNYGQNGENIPSISHPLDLLKYSKSCSIVLFPYQCPDPYGKLDQYLDQIKRGTRTVIVEEVEGSRRIKNRPWKGFLAAGLICLVLSWILDGKFLPRNWKTEPKDFGVSDRSPLGRMIRKTRKFCMGLFRPKKRMVLDTTAMSRTPSWRSESIPADMRSITTEITQVEAKLSALKKSRQVKREIKDVENRLKQLRLGDRKKKAEAALEAASSTPAKKKQSTFGAFGALVGLESPQPVNPSGATDQSGEEERPSADDGEIEEPKPENKIV